MKIIRSYTKTGRYAPKLVADIVSIVGDSLRQGTYVLIGNSQNEEQHTIELDDNTLIKLAEIAKRKGLIE